MWRVSFHTTTMKANLLAAAALTFGAFSLASCADQRIIPAPAPAALAVPAPTSTPTPVPAPSPSTAWIDAPVTPGDWSWSMENGQSVARFAGGRLILRCEPAARTVRIERSEPGSPASSGGATMTVHTQSLTRSFASRPEMGRVAVSLPARDPLLDAMAFTRGRFAVETSGMPPLFVPSWTEVSRVIEDCR
ncbi:hypothetical protein ABVV53_00415 [Novosphingobium sp. RD2P27]|uniref:Lipoprotein n=1 Tax=Novosphingobium kalidii TaxID=3230299 RepID=A0ABV2CWG0_9SPHN